MARFIKYAFNKDGKPLTRELVFLGQHELDINTGFPGSVSGSDCEVEIEVEGETVAFILALNGSEAKKIRAYLERMGY